MGGGGVGFDPGDPEDDPERNVLLAAGQEEIRAANATLPERQREVLALRELEELSYDEIAEIMEHEPQLGGPAHLACAHRPARRAAGHRAGLDRDLVSRL